MARIKLTPEELAEKASSLRNTAQRNEDVINKLDGIISGLVADWEGDAQRAFEESYRTKRATFQSFTSDMSIFANFLVKFSSTMGNEEEVRTNIARGLGM